MTHGFDLENPLICEGVIGDGCGGGRLFMVEDKILKAYDPITKEQFILLENIEDAVKISKSKCIILVECKALHVEFDLASMKTVI